VALPLITLIMFGFGSSSLCYYEVAKELEGLIEWEWEEWMKWERKKQIERERRLREESICLDKKWKERQALFDILKTLWGLLDTIIELMQTVRVYITLILNTVLSGFSEFPNSMQPPCTNMPWTIWPALVELWGLCWMFYTPLSPADERQLQLSLQDAEWTPFSGSGT